METRKCICISYFISDYTTGLTLVVKNEEIRDYYKDNHGYYIKSNDMINTFFPVFFFHRHFVDLIEYRNELISEICL